MSIDIEGNQSVGSETQKLGALMQETSKFYWITLGVSILYGLFMPNYLIFSVIGVALGFIYLIKFFSMLEEIKLMGKSQKNPHLLSWASTWQIFGILTIVFTIITAFYIPPFMNSGVINNPNATFSELWDLLVQMMLYLFLIFVVTEIILGLLILIGANKAYIWAMQTTDIDENNRFFIVKEFKTLKIAGLIIIFIPIIGAIIAYVQMQDLKTLSLAIDSLTLIPPLGVFVGHVLLAVKLNKIGGYLVGKRYFTGPYTQPNVQNQTPPHINPGLDEQNSPVNNGATHFCPNCGEKLPANITKVCIFCQYKLPI